MRRIVLLLAFLLGAQSKLGAAPPPKQSAAAEQRARLEALATRAREWCTLRRESFQKCQVCGGDGRAVYRLRTGVLQEMNCYDCKGHGWRFVEEKARRAWLEYRSPAGREHAAEGFAGWAASVREDPKVVAVVACTTAGQPTAAGSRHALVRTTTDYLKGREQEEHRWYFADGKWWLWTEGADPRWGSEPAVPVDATTVAKFSELLAQAGAAGTLRGMDREGALLVARLTEKAPDAVALEAEIRRDLVTASRTLLKSEPAATAVRVVFLAPYRDRFGVATPGFFRSYQIARDDFDRAVWDNLKTWEERAGLFHVEERGALPEGTVLWLK